MQAVREFGHSRGSSGRKTGQERTETWRASPGPSFPPQGDLLGGISDTEATPQGDVHYSNPLHFSGPQFPQLHMGVSVGCWEDNELIPGWSGPHSPSMISSFTLWSSRTTSSRISCWAESQSEGTDDGSRGCAAGPSPSARPQASPALNTPQTIMVEAQGAQGLPFSPLASFLPLWQSSRAPTG